MKETPSLSVSREVFFTVGSKVLQAVLGFAGILVFANVLGNVVLGEYKTVAAAAFILVQLSEGVASAIKKRVSEVGVSPPEFLTLGLGIHAGFSVLVVVGIAALQPYAVDYFGAVDLAYGTAVLVAALGAFTLVNQLYAGIGYPARSSWLDTIRSVVTLGLQLGFIYLGFKAFGLVLGLALATVVTALLGWLAVRVPPAVPTVTTARRVYEFARYSVPTNYLSNLYSNADPLIIQLFVGPGKVGYFTVASQLTMPGAMFASSIRNALTVKSSGVDSIGGEVRQDLVNACSYTGLISIPILFGALAIPNTLMTTLFGSTFRDAPGLALVGMALFQVSNTYRQPFEAVIEGTDKPGIILRVNVIVFLLYLPLSVGFGQVYGLLGVILGTVLAEVARVAIYQYIAYTEFDGFVFPRPVRDQILAGAAMFVAVEGLSRAGVAVRSWVTLVLLVGVGVVAYFGVLLAISKHFRDTVRFTLADVTGA
jgi:O-antigen/teichoic acid export membrane protein